MIDLIASTGIGVIVGAGLMAWRTAGKAIADVQGGYESAAHWQGMWKHALDTSIANAAAHSRITDASNTKQARIDRALEQVTPGANATVQRIARILRGEA